MNTARILVIEDESAVREVLREGLTQVGHEVLVARDGVEGLQVLETPHCPGGCSNAWNGRDRSSAQD